jgi:hypothetical protein
MITATMHSPSRRTGAFNGPHNRHVAAHNAKRDNAIRSLAKAGASLELLAATSGLSEKQTKRIANADGPKQGHGGNDGATLSGADFRDFRQFTFDPAVVEWLANVQSTKRRNGQPMQIRE